MKGKSITSMRFCQKFIYDDNFVLDEDFLNALKRGNKNINENCLNEISKVLTSLITSLLSYPHCENPKEQLDCLSKIRFLGDNLSPDKVRNLTDTQSKLYRFLHGAENLDFMNCKFKEYKLEQHNPKDYFVAIKKICYNRLELIGNYVKNKFTNLDRHALNSKENSSWQEKVKAENSQKHVKFASRTDGK